MIRVFGRKRLNRYQAVKWLAVDGKIWTQIILIITGLRPALWPSIAEQVQLQKLVSVLFHSYPGLFARRYNGGSINVTAMKYWCLECIERIITYLLRGAEPFLRSYPVCM
jgi:hypothetical protein